MAYPLAVDVEFCHKHKVWRAFKGTKIIAFNEDRDAMEILFPKGHFIPKSDTKVTGSHKGTTVDACRLHFGGPVSASREEEL